jgi:hypothetical protein
MVLCAYGNEPYAPFSAENPLKHDSECMYCGLTAYCVDKVLTINQHYFFLKSVEGGVFVLENKCEI